MFLGVICYFSLSNKVDAWTQNDIPLYQKTIVSNRGNGIFAYLSSITVVENDNFVTADIAQWNVQKFDSNGNFLFVFDTPDQQSIDFLCDIRGISYYNDHYYVLDKHNSAIYKYDTQGKYISTVYHTKINGAPGDPIRFSISDGKMYISDYANTSIFVRDLNGEYILSFGESGSGDGQFIYPTGIKVFDSKIYVADRTNNRVQVFDLAGNFLSKFGSTGSGDGQFNGPVDLNIDSLGNIYVSEISNNRVQKLTITGSYISKVTGVAGPLSSSIDSAGNLYVAASRYAQIHKFNPSNVQILLIGNNIPVIRDNSLNGALRVHVDENNTVYAVDTDNHRILIYNSNDSPVLVLGGYGSGDGQLNTPVGVATNPANGDIYVIDLGNSRIQRFNKNGAFISKFGAYGSENGQFKNPADLAIKNNKIFLIEDQNYRVQVFDLEGNFLYKFGSSGSADGQFNRPWGIDVDNQNRVIVADELNHRVQVFTEFGEFLFKFGTRGTELGQFNTPNSVASDADDNIWVADTNNSRIQVFDKYGNFLYVWGSIAEFHIPSSLAIASDGSIYILDRYADRIRVYRHDREIPVGSIAINSGAIVTNNSNVTLSTAASDALSSVKQMMISENPSFSGATWQPYSQTTEFILSDGNGTKTVYIKYEDLYTNFSEVSSASIVLDKTVPGIKLTKLGLISNLPDSANLSYYFTSQTPMIEGITEANAVVKFVVGEVLYVTNSDNAGFFRILLNNPKLARGKNIITYSSTDAAGNQSAIRTLTLIVGEEYFPEWLYKLVVDEGQSIQDLDQNNKQEQVTEEIRNNEYREEEVFAILIKNSDGNPIVDAKIQINNMYYTTNGEGYIFVQHWGSGKFSYIINNITGEFEFDRNLKVNEIIINDIRNETNSERINYMWLWFIVIIICIISLYVGNKYRMNSRS